MKRLTLLLALALASGSLASAQDRPSNWNRLSAQQQKIWVSNCQPPTASFAVTCAALGGGPTAPRPTAPAAATAIQVQAGPVVVCTDGQRFSLSVFEKAGLTPSEIEVINHNNAATACTGHGRSTDNVLKILEPASLPTPPSTGAAVEKTSAAAVAAGTAAASSPSTPPQPAPKASCAENGSCYGDTSATTGKPKTTHVDGYTRKDGTYVRGHYRSPG